MPVPPHRHRRFFPEEVEEVSHTPVTLIDERAEYSNHPTCPYCHWSEEVPGGWECHRWPPVTNINRPGESMFPIVREKTWCGEFSK